MELDVLNNLLDKYMIFDEERKEFINIIKPIYMHSEFQRRMTDKFLHHSDITLGMHILEDTIKTYLLSKKYLRRYKNRDYNLSIALKISMLHDLYTLPWQNNPLNKSSKFFNKHGFRHPVEAVINAINWFPFLFTNEEDSKKIIDGIIHHMYPLPVICFKDYDYNKFELRNYDLIINLSDIHKKILVWSTNRGKIGDISICRSKYKEGRIMSKADKDVSFGQIKNISSATALLTGKNKKIKK